MINTSTITRIVYDPSPEVVQRQLDRLKMTQAEGAALLRVAPRTMRRWLQDPRTETYCPIPFTALLVLKTAEVDR